MIIFESIVLSLIYVFVSCFAWFSNQKKLDKKHYYLHLNKAYLLLSVIGSAVCLIAGVLVIIFDHWTVAKVFFALSICFAFILTAYFGYRIYYDDEKLMYRKYYGSYKVIYYKDIERIDYIFDIEITSKDLKLSIPSYMANANDFLETVLNNIPAKAKQKIKPVGKVRKFSDSVYRPGEFIFAFVLAYLLAGCALFLLICFWDPDSDGFYVCAITWIFLIVLVCVLPILSIISAKRAHSSKFWNCIAKMLFKDGYLQD